MFKSINLWISDESGATAIEYALIGGLVAIAIVTALTNLGTRLSTNFSEVSTIFK